MKITHALALLLPWLLSLAVGCQATKAPPGEPLVATREAPTAEAPTTPVAVEPPDRDALATASGPPPPEQFIPAPRLADIYFEYDAYEIRVEDTRVLDENAEWLRANPNNLVLIEGHGDERGTGVYNLALGDLRAAAAKRYLAARGIPAARMVAISYGKERPICRERTESCWARNRRAHFLVKPL